MALLRRNGKEMVDENNENLIRETFELVCRKNGISYNKIVNGDKVQLIFPKGTDLSALKLEVSLLTGANLSNL